MKHNTLLVIAMCCGMLYGCSAEYAPTDEPITPATGSTVDGIAKGAYPTEDGLPIGIQFSADGHRLVTGSASPTGIYDFSSIKRVDLTFAGSNWQTTLKNNVVSNTNLEATLAYNGTKLASKVGVSYKGNSSLEENTSEKKSFKVEINDIDDKQELDGYTTLDLNCAFTDNAFMKEVIYEHSNRKYIPCAAVNYVELYINGVYWGIYINSQAINSSWAKEWFLSKKGTRWRAIAEDGAITNEGAGYSSLNYLGSSAATYEKYYNLKGTKKLNPWEDLINLCDTLNRYSGTELEEKVKSVLDLDRTLWFLACENIYEDEDSYVYKGGTDYFLYWDPETGRMTPIEYDGNKIFMPFTFGGTTWTPFLHADDANYPLLHKLLSIPTVRQRYLAHYRTILKETFNPTSLSAMIDRYAAKIDPYIQSDPKKMMTYDQFRSAVTALKGYVTTRYSYLSSYPEISATGLSLSATQWLVNKVSYAQPSSSDTVVIRTTVGGGKAKALYAYCGTGVIGNFSRFQMYDDGAHGDGAANDGVFGLLIAPQSSGTRIRFYIEAVKNDSAGTCTYEPAGAEHDVYTYLVK